MQKVVPTGCGLLDERLTGGLLEKSITLVYGEAETGKTTLAIQCAVNCARIGYKTMFIDCDKTFYPRRMAQIASDDFGELSSQIILMKPEDFEQQATIIERLDDYISARVGLVIVDTITGLYREKLVNEMKETFALNRELNRQMACLAQTTKTQKVATLVTSQVQSTIMGESETVRPVATRVLKFWADTIISLKLTAQTSVIKATVETRGDKKPSKSMFLKIEEKGLRHYSQTDFKKEKR
ncbi:MAG: ATPase domain-containing protein [Candidatus Bathyarchaeia archaeon]